MKKAMWVLGLAALAVFTTSLAYAELANVMVGGDVRLRYNFTDTFLFDEDANNDSFTEQLTRVNVTGKFTEDVEAFIEMQSYGVWGTDFRSDYITGRDFTGNVGEVDLYQAYIAAYDMWGTPLWMKAGRQEIKLGREWLVGNDSTGTNFGGLSFDGISFGYNCENLHLTLWEAKLVELRALETDNDTDFAGAYLTVAPGEGLCADLYWMFVRNANDVFDPFLATDKLHTIGGRVYGKPGMLDYNLEAALQFGDSANAVNDDTGDYQGWGVDGEVGLSLESDLNPRIALRGAYLTGSDDLTNDDVEAFNRLFSDAKYGEILDTNRNLSNVLILGADASAQFTEKIGAEIAYYYFMVAEDNPTVFIAGFPTTLNTDDKLGQEVDLYLNYSYSEDLKLKLGYTHFFTDDGIVDNFVTNNGGSPFAAVGTDDVNYVFAEMELGF